MKTAVKLVLACAMVFPAMFSLVETAEAATVGNNITTARRNDACINVKLQNTKKPGYVTVTWDWDDNAYRACNLLINREWVFMCKETCNRTVFVNEIVAEVCDGNGKRLWQGQIYRGQTLYLGADHTHYKIYIKFKDAFQTRILIGASVHPVRQYWWAWNSGNTIIS